jgi:hypothetical protein
MSYSNGDCIQPKPFNASALRDSYAQSLHPPPSHRARSPSSYGSGQSPMSTDATFMNGPKQWSHEVEQLLLVVP